MVYYGCGSRRRRPTVRISQKASFTGRRGTHRAGKTHGANKHVSRNQAHPHPTWQIVVFGVKLVKNHGWWKVAKVLNNESILTNPSLPSQPIILTPTPASSHVPPSHPAPGVRRAAAPCSAAAVRHARAAPGGTAGSLESGESRSAGKHITRPKERIHLTCVFIVGKDCFGSKTAVSQVLGIYRSLTANRSPKWWLKFETSKVRLSGDLAGFGCCVTCTWCGCSCFSGCVEGLCHWNIMEPNLDRAPLEPGDDWHFGDDAGRIGAGSEVVFWDSPIQAEKKGASCPSNNHAN